MTGEIEKAARAVCFALGQDPDYIPTRWGRVVSAPLWHDYAPAARSALLAVREPGESVEKAGWEAYEGAEDRSLCAAPIFSAMIDTILSAPPTKD